MVQKKLNAKLFQTRPLNAQQLAVSQSETRIQIFLPNTDFDIFPEQALEVFVNTLRLRRNGRHFADDTYKHMNENVRISI